MFVLEQKIRPPENTPSGRRLNPLKLNNTITKLIVTIDNLSEQMTDSKGDRKEIHNIRSRGSESDIYVDMHIMVEPNMTVEASHKLEHNIERQIQNKRE